jgi:HAD superfamily phosphatase (TIGR01668 family)
MNKLLPTFYSENIYDISIDILNQLNIDTLFFDLDNTLDPFYNTVPSEKTLEFINNFTNNGFNVFIISNNHLSRVLKYAKDFNKVKVLSLTYKPLKFKILHLISQNKLNCAKILLIGDQLLTDILVANRLKIKSMLVEPYVSTDLKKTKFNRLIDKRIRAKFKKKGLLVKINEIK